MRTSLSLAFSISSISACSASAATCAVNVSIFCRCNTAGVRKLARVSARWEAWRAFSTGLPENADTSSQDENAHAAQVMRCGILWSGVPASSHASVH
jgi:hypothetical protein